MKAIMRIVKSERGVALAFVAVFLFLFLGFVGIATDAGWIVFVRGQGQARVDAAALGAAVALINQDPSTRETEAQTLADSFGDRNHIVDSNVTATVDNVLTPMHYNPVTRALTPLDNWVPPPNGDFTQPGANAVQAANAVPTPLFFSGVRNALGAAETGSTDINVRATGYLGCPGGGIFDDGLAPIALRACRVGFPGSCNGDRILYQSPDSGYDNSAFTTLFKTGTKYCRDLASGAEPDPPLHVNACDEINLVGSGQTASCFCELKNLYIDIRGCDVNKCQNEATASDCTVTLPVVNTGCAEEVDNSWCGAPDATMNDGRIVGWTTICFTAMTTTASCGGGDGGGGTPNFEIRGMLKCGEGIPGTYTGGSCFGSIASNPILIQ
jgi:hypothetical protein